MNVDSSCGNSVSLTDLKVQEITNGNVTRPSCYPSSTLKNPLSFCLKCLWQLTAKRTYTLSGVNVCFCVKTLVACTKNIQGKS